MKNSSYWQNRFEQLEEAQHTSNVRKYAEIQEQFNIAERTINNQINAWYGRFADANGVSISEARRMLDAKEMAELKWDVQQYIKYGQENALNEKWMRELESASARAHISRLEALRLRTQSECEKLYGNLTDDISDHIASQYEKAYYHTAFEVAKGTNKGANFAALDSKKVEKLIQKPWAADGKNFAIRLGENKANLIDSVYKNVVQMSLTGSGPDKAIESLSKVMNNDKVRASRIIMTESAYFSELAHRDTFRELGVEKYEIVATLDSRTSEICQEMDGKVFDMKVFEPGVTAPPFHPNCRSTTVPYYEDDYGDIGERAARDEEGNTYYVPANITYKEWKKKYVFKQDKDDYATYIAANSLIPKNEELNAQYENNATTIENALHDIESKNYKSDVEIGTVIDINGNIVYQKVGTKGSVQIPNEKLKDNIMTHCHNNGSFLSVGDIVSCIESEALGVRATIESGKYFSLLRVGDVPENCTFAYDMENAVNADIIAEKILKDIDKGLIEGYSREVAKQYYNEGYREFCKKNAHKYGYLYTEGDL